MLRGLFAFIECEHAARCVHRLEGFLLLETYKEKIDPQKVNTIKLTFPNVFCAQIREPVHHSPKCLLRSCRKSRQDLIHFLDIALMDIRNCTFTNGRFHEG